MKDIRKKDNFLYTQSSLATFEACPYKFKLRYLQGLYWSEDEELRESFRRGNEFHLLAERYYMGVEPQMTEGIEEKLLEDLEILKKKYPLKEGWSYYPEFEIRYNEDGIRLLGRYDLILVKPQNKLQIIDFKTNRKKIEEKDMENNLQTKIYLFLLWENYNLVLENARRIKNLEMIYYQTEHPDSNFSIKYDENKHEENKKNIKKIMEEIECFSFAKLEKARVKHCNICEFEKICWKK